MLLCLVKREVCVVAFYGSTKCKRKGRGGAEADACVILVVGFMCCFAVGIGGVWEHL